MCVHNFLCQVIWPDHLKRKTSMAKYFYLFCGQALWPDIKLVSNCVASN